MKRKNKILLVFGFPVGEHWLYKELKTKFPDREVEVVKNKKRVYDSRKSKLNVFKSAGTITGQCLRALFSSCRNDVIVCWSQNFAVILYLLSRLFFKKRRIVSLHWLSPTSSGIRRRLEKFFASSKNNFVVVNSKGNDIVWKNHLSLKNADNFFYVPDSCGYVEFENYKPKSERYCFSGGMNNRDWALLSEVAGRLPEIEFVCVALEKDFASQVENPPKNMMVYFQTAEKKYYELMQNSYLTLLPLKTHNASGLINLIKSAQFCLPCVATKTPATDVYFENKSLLIDGADKEAWIKTIENIFAMNESEHRSLSENYSDYIKKEFSPERTIETILKIIIQSDKTKTGKDRK